MKQIIPLLLVFIFSFTFGQGKASRNTDHLETKRKADEYFSALTELKQFNGNIIISEKGQIILQKTYNLSGAPKEMMVTRNSKFIIASVSKVFVKYGILKLVEEKKITLDDPVSRFFPDFPDGNKITVNHLLHHQSGLPREIKDYDKLGKLSSGQLMELAKKEKLLFEPGTKTLYSNIGFLLLHNIIDKTSDTGYLDFLKKQILVPMGLINTNEYNANISLDGFVAGFDNEDNKITKTSGDDISRFETGNYVSTIDDLFLFSQNGFNGKHLMPELIKELFDEKGILAQAGGRPGYRAYFYKDRDTGYDFIFVSNYSGIPMQQITEDIVKILDGRPYQVPHKIERKPYWLSEKQLKRYTGKYTLEADQSQFFTISIKDGKLIVTGKDGDITEVFPDSETTFFFDAASNDGLIFTFNKKSGSYDLTMISDGLRLKTKKEYN